MIDICMFMYKIWRTNAAGLMLCLVSNFEKRKRWGDDHIHRYELHIFIVLCTLVIHSFPYFRYIYFIVLMSVVCVSINFNWLSIYSNLCILCSDRTTLDYDFIMTCRSYLIYISIHWVYMYDLWGQSIEHVWSDHCL